MHCVLGTVLRIICRVSRGTSYPVDERMMLRVLVRLLVVAPLGLCLLLKVLFRVDFSYVLCICQFTCTVHRTRCTLGSRLMAVPDDRHPMLLHPGNELPRTEYGVSTEHDGGGAAICGGCALGLTCRGSCRTYSSGYMERMSGRAVCSQSSRSSSTKYCHPSAFRT